MNEEIFFTERQLRRQQRNEAIKTKFALLQQQFPNVSESRIIKRLSEEFDLACTTILYVLKGRKK